MTHIDETGIAQAVRLAGSQTALAKGLTRVADARGRSGITPQAVQKWVSQGVVPAERCRDIEELLGNQVTRYQLNPSVFGTHEDAIAAAKRKPAHTN